MADNETQATAEATPDKYQELERKLQEAQGQISQTQVKNKELSVLLTKNQQELAELYRFHKATLPKINKSFAEDWDESPEQAVEKRVERQVKPIEQKYDEIGTEVGRLKAQTALQSLLIRYPHWNEYVDKVRELGEEEAYASLTWQGEKGIKALFKIAGAAEGKAPKEEKVDSETEVKVTERTYTEGSSAKGKESNGKIKLNPDELLIARKLGVKPEDYYKYKHTEAE